MHWIFTNLKTLKKHGFKFFQSDKATTIEFHLLHARKAKKTWIYYETIRRHVFFKLRNLLVIFLQAGKTQEYEDFLLRAQKVKKASIEFFRSEMFSKNKCMDSILSRFKKLQKHGFIFFCKLEKLKQTRIEFSQSRKAKKKDRVNFFNMKKLKKVDSAFSKIKKLKKSIKMFCAL